MRGTNTTNCVQCLFSGQDLGPTLLRQSHGDNSPSSLGVITTSTGVATTCSSAEKIQMITTLN